MKYHSIYLCEDIKRARNKIRKLSRLSNEYLIAYIKIDLISRQLDNSYIIEYSITTCDGYDTKNLFGDIKYMVKAVRKYNKNN